MTNADGTTGFQSSRSRVRVPPGPPFMGPVAQWTERVPAFGRETFRQSCRHDLPGRKERKCGATDMTDADGITSDLQVAGSIPAGYEHFRSCSSVAERENISSTLAVMPLHESNGRPLAAGRGECLRDYRQTRSVMDAARREGSNPSLALCEVAKTHIPQSLVARFSRCAGLSGYSGNRCLQIFSYDLEPGAGPKRLEHSAFGW